VNVCTVIPTKPETARRLSNASIVPESDVIRGMTGSEVSPKNVHHYVQLIRKNGTQKDSETD